MASRGEFPALTHPSIRFLMISNQPSTDALLKNAFLELKKRQAKLDALEAARTEPIAIVGVGCRFPGGAYDPAAFWKSLVDGIDAATEIPNTRWDVDAFYDPDPEAPGKMYTRQGSWLGEDQIEQFDPRFFGIAPREAQSMDPQQRLLLEVSWEAMEHAGLAPATLKGSSTGVFVGIFRDDYAQFSQRVDDCKHIDAYNSLGTSRSIAVGRVSYLFGFRGPAVQIDTACSSSLVAIHLACQSLRSGECNLALAGGVNLMLTPAVMIGNCKLKALAMDGRCKTFDASADGYGRGEGCGVVVLKRLSDAVAAGDHILATVRGSAVNHDGHSNGLTAPSGPAQEALLAEALANAKVRPEQVQYVEVHGTGTVLGDPIEVSSLGKVLGKGRSKDSPLLLGTVKTNFGHLEGAAGVAAIIKVALSLHHKAIPPHLHLKQPNAYIPWDRLPVEVNTQLRDWETAGEARMAGVSAFGMSGTNAHIVLSEAPLLPQKSAPCDRPHHILTLSTKNDAALPAMAERYLQYLSAAVAPVDLANLCYSANVGRSHFDHRLCIVADDTSQLKQQLAAYLQGETTALQWTGKLDETQGSPAVAFIFTGQGSQYIGMGRELYSTQPVFRAVLDECDRYLSAYLDKSLLLDVLYPDDPSSHNGQASDALLNQTAYTQPALFALEYALAQLWMSWGIEPAVVMGHSVGEYVAACIAGVFSLEEGLRLIAKRAQLMQALPQNGAMVAVFADKATVAAVIAPYPEQIAIAAVNGPQSIVISGVKTAIDGVVRQFKQQRIPTKRLTVSHAFHSPCMRPMLDAFAQVASTINYAPAKITVMSNLTGQPSKTTMANADYWVNHVCQSVEFATGMTRLSETCPLVLEIGPKPVLLGMASQFIADLSGYPSLRQGRAEWQSMLSALAALYSQGAAVDWRGFDQPYPRQKLHLPTYPFQRQRFALQRVDAQVERPVVTTQLAPLLHQQLQVAGSSSLCFQTQLNSADLDFLLDHRVFDSPILPATAYIEIALSAGQTLFKTSDVAVESLAIRQALVLSDDGQRQPTLQIVLQADGDDRYSFQIFSQVLSGQTFAPTVEPKWTLHAAGKVTQSAALTPESLDIANIQAHYQQHLSADEHYQICQSRGVTYGPYFQAVKQSWHDDDAILAEIQLPEDLTPSLPDFILHPVLLDACLQTSVEVAPGGKSQKGRNRGTNSQTKTYLPIGFKRLHRFRPLTPHLFSYLQIRPKSSKSKRMIADLVLSDRSGLPLARVEGLTFQAVDPAQLLTQTAQVHQWMHRIVWEAQAHTAVSNPEPAIEPAAQRWLIFNDTQDTGLKLVEQLEQQGHHCTLVSPGPYYIQQPAGHCVINPASPEDFQRLLQTELPYNHIVHLWSLDVSPLDLAQEADTPLPHQLQSCGSVLHLVQALGNAESATLPQLWLVTRGTQGVTQKAAPIALKQAALWGLGRTIALEYPALHTVCLDLDRQPPATEANNAEVAQLLQEITRTQQPDLAQVNPSHQVAWRQGKRYVAKLQKYKATKALPNPAIKADGSYLITGGLGSLGLQVAEWLAKQGAGQVVLLGRSAPKPEVQARLDQLAVPVLVLKADVSQRHDIAQAIAAVQTSDYPLRGVFHAAGVLDDGTLLQTDWASFERVMTPKVSGAWFLHQLTQEIPLDLFVCFSSMASLLGAPGQGNYATANAFMDALAHYRQAMKLPGLSINWGPWNGLGMAERLDQRLQERLAKQGIEPLTPEQGLLCLGELLQQRSPQVGVFHLTADKYLTQFPHPAQIDFMSHYVSRRAVAVKPQTAALLQQIEAAPIYERLSVLQSHLCRTVAQILGISLADLSDIETRGFSELGMDSLMAVELRNQLETGLGCSLPTTLAYKYPTVQALVTYLSEALISLDFTDPSAAHPAALIPAHTEDSIPASPLDDLSQDEVADLLSAELMALKQS